MRESKIDFQSIMNMEKEDFFYWINKTKNVIEKENNCNKKQQYEKE